MARRTPAHASTLEEARLMQMEVLSREHLVLLRRVIGGMEHIYRMASLYLPKDEASFSDVSMLAGLLLDLGKVNRSLGGFIDNLNNEIDDPA